MIPPLRTILDERWLGKWEQCTPMANQSPAKLYVRYQFLGDGGLFRALVARAQQGRNQVSSEFYVPGKTQTREVWLFLCASAEQV